jgi:hypothetical protein
MKTILTTLFSIVIIIALFTFGTNAESVDCMRKGRGKYVMVDGNSTYRCPAELPSSDCYYKIDCSEAGNPGGGTGSN